jgi:hypothetical protein
MSSCPRGSPSGVKGLTASGKEIGIAEPEGALVGHELFGETFKYLPGNAGLRNDIVKDSDKVIQIENEIRDFLGLPHRSGTDHGYVRTTITVTP